MTRKREIIIQNQEDGQLLLNWLSSRYTYHDRDKWLQYINEERVTLNNLKTTPDTALKALDKITYTPEPIIEPPINRDYKTIYEDDDLLIINKPSDIPCHPGGIYFENTLWYLLKAKYEYISLINRLDRETSGVMLIAKNKEAAKFYFNKMMDREIEKEYSVLVHGSFPEELDCKGWLTPDKTSVIRKKRKFILDLEAEQPEGEGNPEKQFCHSKFKLTRDSNGFSLVRGKILTGRTHQIRATLSSMGYPVVGDKIYGINEDFFFKFINNELTTSDWELLILENQALHSLKTTVPMISGEIKEFFAEEPEVWFLKSDDCP